MRHIFELFLEARRMGEEILGLVGQKDLHARDRKALDGQLEEATLDGDGHPKSYVSVEVNVVVAVLHSNAFAG